MSQINLTSYTTQLGSTKVFKIATRQALVNAIYCQLRKGLDTVESLSAEASGNLLTNRNFYYCKVGPIFLVLQDLSKLGLLQPNLGKIFLVLQEGPKLGLLQPNLGKIFLVLQKGPKLGLLQLNLGKYFQFCRRDQNQGFCCQILVKYFQFCRRDQKQGFCPQMLLKLLCRNIISRASPED